MKNDDDDDDICNYPSGRRERYKTIIFDTRDTRIVKTIERYRAR